MVACILLVTLVSGMAWSTYWGANFAALGSKVTPSSWTGETPSSLGTRADLDRLGNHIHWATGDQPIPASYAVPGDGTVAQPLTLDSVVAIGELEGMKPGYSVLFPDNSQVDDAGNPLYGPFVLSNSWPRATGDARDAIDDRSVSRASTERAFDEAPHGEPDRERRRVRLVEPLDELLRLREEAVGVGREPEELGELADDDRDRQAVHVADLDLLREQVGDEADAALRSAKSLKDLLSGDVSSFDAKSGQATITYDRKAMGARKPPAKFPGGDVHDVSGESELAYPFAGPFTLVFKGSALTERCPLVRVCIREDESCLFELDRRGLTCFDLLKGTEVIGGASSTNMYNVQRPFTLKISPVTKLDSSLARNTIGAAISSGDATRPSGIVSRILRI